MSKREIIDIMRSSKPGLEARYGMKDLQPYILDILQVAGKYGIFDVRIFGSYASGTPTNRSDIDLLVNLEDGRDLLDLISFKQEIEERTGHKVDVVTKRGLSKHLREQILTEALSL